MTPGEVAAVLFVSRQTLSRWRQQGIGPAWIRLGPRTYRYTRAAVEAYRDTA
jgi:excisionase family DNA binding protein